MTDNSDDKSKNKSYITEALVVQNIMQTENGREYMWKHLQNMSVFENIFHEDPIKHAYRAGIREAGLQLNSDLKLHAPDNYIKMIKENIDG